MAKPVVPLSDFSIKNATLHTVNGKVTSRKLTDGGGLYVLLTLAGGKLWRFDYRYEGKRKTIALGSYPQMTLAAARKRREGYRDQLAAGADPGASKKTEAEQARENTFGAVAQKWYDDFSKSWSPSHSKTVLARLQNDVFPFLGGRNIGELKPLDINAVLERVQDRGALETAHRIRTVCGQVMRYAVAKGKAERDITADLKGSLPPYKPQHHAAIIAPPRIGELLRAIDKFEGTYIVKTALRFAPLVFLRPGELRQAQWSEINLDAAEWNIPAERMKVKDQGDHLVPLSRQAVALLRDIQPLTGRGRYVFHGARSTARPMSENTLNAALRKLGFDKHQMTTHGFRAMARTVLDEGLKIRPDIVEHQLGHKVRDVHGRAYNRTSFVDERREMMQLWADYLDEIKREL